MPIRNTYEFVRKEFEKRDCVLLSNEYKNNNQRLEYQCPFGHINEVRFNDFKKTGCSICSRKKKHTLEFVKGEFDKMGLVLLSTEYKSANKKLTYKCKLHGHINKKKYSKLYIGRGCHDCGGTKKYTYEFVKNEFEKREFELLSNEYKNSITKLNYRCPKGHLGETIFKSFKYGHGCSTCTIYKNENKCREIFETHFKKSFIKCRPKWVNRLELDGYNQELELAFEYQGQQHYDYIPFFHINGIIDLEKQQEHDKRKKNICNNKNIKLIIIPYTIKYDNLENFIINKIESL